jgi:hypothetical protein
MKVRLFLDSEDVFNRSTEAANLDSTVVQSRLTITGFALTVLIFSGSFTTALYGTFRNPAIDYRIAFLAVEMSLALGIIASVLAIASFLMSLQMTSSRPSWFSWFFSGQWWFSVGQILLYLALSQALTSSLSEVVYGIQLGTIEPLQGPQSVAWWVGVAALPAWWFLLFFGPIDFIRRISKNPTTFHSPGLVALIVVYVLAVLGVLIASAEAYSIRGSGGFQLEVSEFPRAILHQIFQPVTWYGKWGHYRSSSDLGLAALIIGVVLGLFAMVTFIVWRFGKRGETPARTTSAPEDDMEAAPKIAVEEPKPPDEESSPNKEPPPS